MSYSTGLAADACIIHYWRSHAQVWGKLNVVFTGCDDVVRVLFPNIYYFNSNFYSITPHLLIFSFLLPSSYRVDRPEPRNFIFCQNFLTDKCHNWHLPSSRYQATYRLCYGLNTANSQWWPRFALKECFPLTILLMSSWSFLMDKAFFLVRDWKVLSELEPSTS